MNHDAIRRSLPMCGQAMAFILAVILLAPATLAWAHDPPSKDGDPIGNILNGAKPTLDVRARYEFGKQTNVEQSNATTIRARVGVLSPVFNGFQAFAEMEHTEAADRDGYRAASIHGPTSKTVIADPESTELNRMWISYKGFDTTAKLGRQRIKLNNLRFVGNVGWRQNEQTYDALRIVNNSIENLTLDYSYVINVLRIFGDDDGDAAHDDFDSRSHFANATYKLGANHKLGAYAYFMDLRNTGGNNNSNNTWGVHLGGKLPVSDDLSLGYYGEYAKQKDADGSTLSYRADYWHGKVSATFGKKYTVGVGYESLGADDGDAFRTPLATLHKWNGFADVFLSTPMEGLNDAYAFVSMPLPCKMTFKAFYHDFSQEDSRGDTGHEYDLVLVKQLPWKIKALAKYARYTSEVPNAVGDTRALASDWTRVTFQLEYKY